MPIDPSNTWPVHGLEAVTRLQWPARGGAKVNGSIRARAMVSGHDGGGQRYEDTDWRRFPPSRCLRGGGAPVSSGLLRVRWDAVGGTAEDVGSPARCTAHEYLLEDPFGGSDSEGGLCVRWSAMAV